jgi:phage terminase small subunit
MTTTDRPLTAKQQAFCTAWGANGGNASAAMRAAYDTSRMDDATIRKRASELLRHAGVAARIAELRAKASEKAEITIADVLRTLATNLQIAMGDRPVAAKVLVRNKETGAVSVGEVEVTDRDGGVVARTADVLLKALGGYEIDHEQAAQAVAAAASSRDGSNSRDLARAVLDILRQAQLAAPQSAEDALDEPAEDIEGDDPETNGGLALRGPPAAADLAAAAAAAGARPSPAAAAPSGATPSPRIRRFNPETGKLEDADA